MSTITINNLYNRNDSPFGLVLVNTNKEIVNNTVVSNKQTYDNLTPGFYDIYNYDSREDSFIERLVAINVNSTSPIITEVMLWANNITARVLGKNSDILSIAESVSSRRPRGNGNTYIILGFIFLILLFLVIAFFLL